MIKRMLTPSIISLLTTVIMSSAALLSCSKTKNAVNDSIMVLTTSNLEEIVPKKIAVSPSKLILSVGEYSQLSVNGIYPYGQNGPITKDITWIPGDTSIFDVDTKGVAIGKKEGTSQLRVEKLGTSTTIEVTIKPPSITQVILFPEEPKVTLAARLSLPIPQKFELEAFGLKTNGELERLDPASVIWSSSNDEALSWTQADGLVAKRPGSWKVTAKYGILEKTKTVAVTQVPLAVERIEALESPIVMRFGETRSVSVRAIMNDASVATDYSGVTLTPTIDNQLRVTASNTQIQAIGSGKSSLKVAFGGKELLIPVYIQEASVTSITLEPSEITLRLGESQSFVATAHFSDGTAANISSGMTTSSSDPTVMSVVGGTVKGDSLGSANLTVSFRGASTQIFVNVGATALASLEFLPASFTLIAGRTQAFQVWGVKTDGSKYNLTANTDVIKSVLLTAIGEIIPTNTLRGKAKGVTRITATYVDPSTGKNIAGSALVTVLAPVLEVISFDPPISTQPAGRFEDFRIKGLYSDNTELDITSKAKINIDAYSLPAYSYCANITKTPTGRIRARGIVPGQIKILATLDGVVGSVVFNSIEKIVESVAIKRTGIFAQETSMDKGTTGTIIAEATYSDGSKGNFTHGAGPNRTISWSVTANADKATVTAEGDHMRVDGIYQGLASFDFVLVDNDPLVNTLSSNFQMSVQVPCGDGYRKSFFCYFLGNDGDSCTTTCGNARRANNDPRAYDPATLYELGSTSGSNTCKDLVGEDWKNWFTPQASFDPYSNSTEAIGCAVLVQLDVNIGLRATTTTTNAGASAQYFRRVCACE